MGRLSGLRELVHAAIHTITNLVEDTHEAAARKPVAVLSRIPPLEAAVRGVDEIRRFAAKTAFDSVRAVNRGVQGIGDEVASLIAPGIDRIDGERVRAELPAMLNAWMDGAQGGLNAVIGDFLEHQGNGLAIEMGFWHSGSQLELTREGLERALGNGSPKLCVFLHGLGCTEHMFRPRATAQPSAAEPASQPSAAEPAAAEARVEYAARLSAELGFTSLYLRYNSGLHISENGRELARLLDVLVASLPCEVQEIVLIGHSMGGLVARSAAHYAQADQRAWSKRLTHVLCIGSPHLGVPLEKVGNALASVLGSFDLAGTQVPAKVLNARSAGVKDLRFGYLLDEEWTERDPDAFLRDERRDVPFAEGVIYGFIAASCFEDAEHPMGAWLGDLLVRAPSASGRAPDQSRHIPFHIGHSLQGIHHQALLTHPAVYAQLVRFLASRSPNVPEPVG